MLRSASRDEIRKAKAIMARAPRTTPLAVMQYFADLRDINDRCEAYNAGWHGRWNPVILGFFEATDTEIPSQDNSFWCAAFLNWCLERCGYRPGTRSSSSGTFRGLTGATNNPRRGDIAVFQDGASRCTGHVGLFVGRRNGRVLVIGGNQKQGQHYSVNIKELPVPGTSLRVHSYLRMSDLRPPLSNGRRC
ncbi:CHAP domain-containing protein [Sinorhizobium meliloti]|uniref:CHAP domain-containing protein n=1 Tax=Rhizobium meliloti TaxID=382 RepID=UPI003B527E03